MFFIIGIAANVPTPNYEEITEWMGSHLDRKWINLSG